MPNKIFNRSFFQAQEVGIFISLILLSLIIGFVNSAFWNAGNLIEILRSISFMVIVGVGETLVLISGGLDLSVGSILAVGGVISGLALVNQLPITLALFFGMLSGLLLGWLNGFIITRFKIPPLITTLGMLYVARGIVLVITKGRPLYPFPDAFNAMGQGSFGGIPYVVFFMIVFAIAAHWVLNYTTLGRSIYAIGGNEQTARTSGIDVDRIKLITYSIAGLMSGITGILMAARLSSAQSNAGTGWELTVIASVIIGGTSMFGGAGSILGTLIGAALMAVITNGMVLMNVSVYWQNIVVGIIIVVAVGLDQYRKMKLSA
ncbi:ABC transporter permease [Moorella naiadis]|uniref:ABC transporter permease n=1 Tax=Moorella naiadis (nom. illeg.) TaxID=3093670 RepID=UPI003D9CA806